MAPVGAAAPAVHPTPAPVLAAVGFALLMVFLGVLAWDGDGGLPNLTQVVSALVAAMLGAVVNPGPRLSPWAWTACGVAALLAAASAGVAILCYPRHVDAVPALTSSVAAFAGLFVNTSAVTHPSSD
ncbi:hypothetical protein ACIGXM_13700 [Kitasatospora sp. NPDC052896]|uniref:hypothetical protein n=1 Tax=Kitasatospora sp. NPDC052896 TaxID=3364061 RepID=UPI0037C64DA3